MTSTYLERRLNTLLTNFEKGKILFPNSFLEDDDKKKIIEELMILKKLPDGRVDINTATPLVRSFSRAFYNLDIFIAQENKVSPKVEANVTIPAIISIQREYLNLLEEFFISATGVKPSKFIKENEYFSDGIHKRSAVELAKLMEKSYPIFIPKIQEFHKKYFHELTSAKDIIGGLKCVFGGSSRVNQSTFDSYRKMSLYSDTIFIPDPILPWLEVDRKEEKYNLVYLLQECFYLLKFKPLIDADLPYPGVIIFPSWEKILEQNDEATQDGISSLFIRFFSHYLESNFEDESEIYSYVQGIGKDKFRSIVIKKNLFIPPNSSFPSSFQSAYDSYMDFIKEHKSDEFIEMISSTCPEIAVLNGIMERLAPQFHVLDNSSYLNAHPLFYLSVFYHYYMLCSDIAQEDLNNIGIIDKNTLAILNNLNHPSNSWLGNVPMKDIIIFRKDNLNAEFRRRINENINELKNIPIDDINMVASEIGKSLSSLITEHDKAARKISDEYFKKHIVTAGMSILTLGVSFYPFLAPLLGTFTALSPLGKYVYDNLNHHFDRRPLKKSMLGILADTHKKAV